MAYTGAVHRWDVFWADLDPGVGNEQKGNARPVIVISNDGVNAALGIVTVLSATKLEGKHRKVYPFEVVLPKGTLTEAHASLVMPQQIRSISKLRLLEKIGTLGDPALQATIETRVLEHLGIEFEAEEM